MTLSLVGLVAVAGHLLVQFKARSEVRQNMADEFIDAQGQALFDRRQRTLDRISTGLLVIGVLCVALLWFT